MKSRCATCPLAPNCQERAMRALADLPIREVQCAKTRLAAARIVGVSPRRSVLQVKAPGGDVYTFSYADVACLYMVETGDGRRRDGTVELRDSAGRAVISFIVDLTHGIGSRTLWRRILDAFSVREAVSA